MQTYKYTRFVFFVELLISDQLKYHSAQRKNIEG